MTFQNLRKVCGMIAVDGVEKFCGLYVHGEDATDVGGRVREVTGGGNGGAIRTGFLGGG